MSLLAEEIVEEWLNRQGFFTIRGIRVGVGEMDVLAVRPRLQGGFECWHVEVQCSINPVSYLVPLPRQDRKDTGRAATSAGWRSPEQLAIGAKEWVEKKYLDQRKEKVRHRLWPNSEWEYHLVVNELFRADEQIAALGDALPELRLHRFSDVLSGLGDSGNVIGKASGHDLCELLQMSSSDSEAL
ncbi:MAG: hypothetical protein M1274_04415 [Actinobacteria bacterium]|nr:hypothetical protein [Actinomycetota bacterium]